MLVFVSRLRNLSLEDAVIAAMAKKSILITGASSGFGRLTAEAFADAGWQTFAAMRNIATSNADAAAQLRQKGIDVVELDVTSDQSVDAAAAFVARVCGGLDVLVNNAGVASFGIQEAFTPAAVEHVYAANVFGPLRVNRAFLPSMRERRTGLVVYISSVVGRIVNPFGGVYASSKWALEALAEASSYELAPFGVDVSIVEPGAFLTEILGKVGAPDDEARAASYGALQAVADAAPARIAERAKGNDPADIAKKILQLALAPAGDRPLRSVVPQSPPVEAINAAHAPIQLALVSSLGVPELIPPSIQAADALSRA
jgi:NAD(P)-dependent dehydrogenase (short-subunit alcohol dehydrogenase family)